ncbi:MAG: malate synthase A [Chloroflexi bacterium]|nr:malate synthase A [Chloroflexota bacterium]
MSSLSNGIELRGKHVPEYDRVLTRDAIVFVAKLAREFGARRDELLAARRARQAEIDAGKKPDFLKQTAQVRESEWQVAPTPKDLQKRWVEITGPTERKMIINALNSGADVFMADFEDANTPAWHNMVIGHANLSDAIARSISFKNPDGKEYKLNEKTATLLVRPRGWHLDEKHFWVDGKPIAGAWMDFGLYFFHNARALMEKGTAPYFYLPKTESHLEARLWNDVFNLAQDELKIPRGTIRATVLIENVLAAFEMDEILYELRDHCSGLNAGRWDYIFSCISKFRNDPAVIFPDRAQITMTVPFMRAYTELLIKTCHRRGAHAMGGMSAFIPNRRDPQVTDAALAQVRADKVRESNDGFDGTWVAHPDLVETARAPFAEKLGAHLHQKERLRNEVIANAAPMIDFRIANGIITEKGVRNNISVALQYLEAWLGGNGAVAIFNLMEDAATCEIARAQIWQWLQRGAQLDDGRKITRDLVRGWMDEELQKIRAAFGDARYEGGNFKTASEIVLNLVTADQFAEFLTLMAYEKIDESIDYKLKTMISKTYSKKSHRKCAKNATLSF